MKTNFILDIEENLGSNEIFLEFNGNWKKIQGTEHFL